MVANTGAAKSNAGNGLLPMNLRTREALAAYLFLAPFIILFSIFVVRAVFTAQYLSFFDWQILKPKRPFVGLSNYRELFNDDVWWIALKNTIVFTIMTVAGTTILSLSAAIAVTKPIKGNSFFRILFYMPALLSVGVVGLTWSWLLSNQFGVINYGLSFLGLRPLNWLGSDVLVIPSLVFTSIWWGFGFPMLVFIAGLQGIPEMLYEAARIDGADGRQLLFGITLPLLRPTMLFVTVTGVIAHFQVYGQPAIMTNGGPGRASYTVIFYLYEVAWRSFRMGYGCAVSVALAVIMAAFTIIQFKLVGQQAEY